MIDMTRAVWRKSSRSGGQSGNCVEVATNLPGVVGVRDSKDPQGAKFALSPKAWAAFADGVKQGSFDL